MKAVTGNLSMLGAATQGWGAKTYLTIEIGDQVLKKKLIGFALDGYLIKALEDPEEVTLYIDEGLVHDVIVGIKFSNGKLYCTGGTFGGIPKEFKNMNAIKV